MSLYNYDPADVVVTFKGLVFLGPANGTFVTCERTSDAFSMNVGALGDVVRIRNRDKSGSVTYVAQSGSPLNAQLSAIALEDELFGSGVGPILVKHTKGPTLCKADQAWIRKIANAEFGTDEVNRTWIIDVARFDIFVGGY